jgi:hypothetical protein
MKGLVLMSPVFEGLTKAQIELLDKHSCFYRVALTEWFQKDAERAIKRMEQSNSYLEMLSDQDKRIKELEAKLEIAIAGLKKIKELCQGE